MRTSGGHFLYLREFDNIGTKPATTYQEQIEILKSRNVIIEDKQFCEKALSSLNYYRLTAYMLLFKDFSKNTYSDISFERIYYLYEFDRELRSLLIGVLEEIEIFVRTKIAYYHAHKFGPVAYLDSANYNHWHQHDKFIEHLNNAIYQNRDNDFVKHHSDSKDGKFPIWVAVELFSFGMISKFYADLLPKDKKKIAREHFDTGFEQLESWLQCLYILRNRCAHYMRLYYYRFNKAPKDRIAKTNRFKNMIFDYILIIKECYPHAFKWNMEFVAELEQLILEYNEFIDLSHIGFPSNWKDELMKS